MKVKLINVAEYEVKDAKTTQIPFETFKNLCGYEETSGGSAIQLPKVRLFKSFEEFNKLQKEEFDELNVAENVRVLSNGQFLVFLNINVDSKKEDLKSDKKNATANP